MHVGIGRVLQCLSRSLTQILMHVGMARVAQGTEFVRVNGSMQRLSQEPQPKHASARDGVNMHFETGLHRTLPQTSQTLPWQKLVST